MSLLLDPCKSASGHHKNVDCRTMESLLLHPEWREPLSAEFDKPHMKKVVDFLRKEKQAGKVIFPSNAEVFQALNMTLPSTVRVVVLGQDPYHGADQAHGLSFSVKRGQRIPPSLRNIYRELSDDIGCSMPSHGCLDYWAEQGVLLLNAVLTVEQGRPGSHQGRGWERFTDTIIEHVNQVAAPSVFLLWGAQAQKKGLAIDKNRHLVLHAPHPSPLSAYRGYFGCRHFSTANQFLVSHSREPIDWRLPCE